MENPNLHTYQDGVGYIRDYPEVHEVKAFSNVIHILGLILLYKVIFDTCCMFFIPLILEQHGFDIHYNFLSGQFTGNDTLLITHNLITKFLGRFFPLIILVYHLKMPFSVMLPVKISNKSMFKYMIPTTFLTTGVCLIMSYFYEQILSLCHISTERTVMIPEKTSDLIYLLIAEILIIPIISELGAHGIILQLTRQFGDGTALCITTIIMSAAEYDITLFPFNIVTSLVIGYFTIRTGSVLAAIVMRIIQTAYIYALYLMNNLIDSTHSEFIIKLFLFVTILIGFIMLIHILYFHSDKFNLNIKEGFMSTGRKILTAVTCVPLIIWFTIMFVITALNIKFVL